MFHNDDTLSLLEKYTKTKYNEKESGKFRTKDQEKKASVFLWIFVAFLVGIFISANLKTKNEKKIEIKQEVINIPQKTIQTTQPTIEQKIEITPSKPITKPNITIAEPTQKRTTIVVTPQQSQQKKEPINKIEEVEEVEEIKPGSSYGNVRYYK